MISFWKTKLFCRYKLRQSCKLFLCVRRNLLIFRNWRASNFVPVSSGTISIKTLSLEEQLHTVTFLRISTRHGNVQIHTVPFQAVFFHLCECLEIAQKTEFIDVLIRLFKSCIIVMRTCSSVTRKYFPQEKSLLHLRLFLPFLELSSEFWFSVHCGGCFQSCGFGRGKSCFSVFRRHS